MPNVQQEDHYHIPINVLGKEPRTAFSRWTENVVIENVLKRKECIRFQDDIYVHMRNIELTITGTIDEFRLATVQLDNSLDVSARSIVVKTFLLNEDDNSEVNAVKELTLQRYVNQLESHLIVPILEVARIKSKIFGVLPYVANGDLFKFIKQKQFAGNVEHAKRTMREMVRAVAACHDAGVMHGDLSPENFMMIDDATPALIDFGQSSLMGHGYLCKPGRVGKEFYMAPEMFALSQDIYDGRKVDIWSLGITFFVILSNDASPPWHFASNKDIYFSHAQRDFQTFLSQQFPDLQIFSNLLVQMLEIDPCKRLSAQQVLDHEWFLESC